MHTVSRWLASHSIQAICGNRESSPAMPSQIIRMRITDKEGIGRKYLGGIGGSTLASLPQPPFLESKYRNVVAIIVRILDVENKIPVS